MIRSVTVSTSSMTTSVYVGLDSTRLTAPSTAKVRNYIVSEKNEPTLASFSFDKHGLILIILSKRHQRTFRNYMHILFSLFLHFYLLYLLLNSCDRNDANDTRIPW